MAWRAAHWVECLPLSAQLRVCSSVLQVDKVWRLLVMLALGRWKQDGKKEVQGHPQLHSELEASLGYTGP